jgi:rod shape-determining protein MreB
MLNQILGIFSHDIGIDLGTANTYIGVKDKGILIKEPSVVAINTKSRQVLAVGRDAKNMLGKTPSTIVANYPLKDGVISDLETAEKMIEYFIKSVHQTSSGVPKIPRPRAVIGVPSGVTEVEQRAVLKVAKAAGVRKAYLIEEPMAAAIGLGLKVNTPNGNIIVDIGGGTTEIAVISLGGIVVNKSLRVGGQKQDEAIVNYARERFSIVIGEKKAEEAKITVGDVFTKEVEKGKKRETFEVRGRSLKTGIPQTIKLSALDMQIALKDQVDLIIDSIKQAIEDTPPELVSDVLENGLYLAGGGANLVGLDKLIEEKVGITVHKQKECEYAVVRGTMMLLDDIDLLELVNLSSS